PWRAGTGTKPAVQVRLWVEGDSTAAVFPATPPVAGRPPWRADSATKPPTLTRPLAADRIISRGTWPHLLAAASAIRPAATARSSAAGVMMDPPLAATALKAAVL